MLHVQCIGVGQGAKKRSDIFGAKAPSMRAPTSATAAAGRTNLGNACQKISSPATRRARAAPRQAVLGQACMGLLGCLGLG